MTRTPDEPPKTYGLVSGAGGFVPVDLPVGMSGDAFQQRFTLAAEDIGGRRKRAMMGEDGGLMHTLLAVAMTQAAGATPVPRTQANVDQAPDAWIRLSALQKMSHQLFEGAHWLAEPLPKDKGQARSILIQDAERVYVHIKSLGHTPDKYTLNSMVAAYANANLKDKAQDFVLSEFPAAGVIPCERTCRSFVKLALASGDVDQALALVRALKSELRVKPSVDCYGPIVHELARQYRLSDSFEVLKEMEQNKLRCSEHYLFLLRQRCKSSGVWNEIIPPHPVAWQFTPKVRLLKKAQGKRTKRVSQFLRSKATAGT